MSRLLEALRQNPRQRVARRIARRIQAILHQEQRAVLTKARAARKEREATAREQAKTARAAQAAARREARDELARRKRAVREAAKKLREKRKRHPDADPDLDPAFRAALADGTLTTVLTPPPADAPPDTPPRVQRFPPVSPPAPLPLVTFCEIAQTLGIHLGPNLRAACDKAQRRFVRTSPAAAVGLDAPDDWPPGAPSMAPWLAARCARALTAFPKLLAHADALDPADECWLLTHAITAIRILTALGMDRTYPRLLPVAGAFTARDHRYTPDGRPNLCGPACHDPDCGAGPLECHTPTPVPLDLYPHLPARTLGADLEARAQAWRHEPHDILRAELYTTLSEEAWTLANGGTCPIDYAWPPDLAAVLALAHYNLWPLPTTPPARLAAFLTLATPAARAVAPALLTQEAVSGLARQVGITLLPGLVAH